MLPKGLQNYTNLQHKSLHMGSTPLSPLYTMCKKTSDLVDDGFPKKDLKLKTKHFHILFFKILKLVLKAKLGQIEEDAKPRN